MPRRPNSSVTTAISPANLVLGLTGASGAPYAARLLEVLLRAGRTVHVTISPAAVEVFAAELGRTIDLKKPDLADLLPASSGMDAPDVPLERLLYHHYQDFRAGIASGSFLTAGMVICPCSMGTAAAIAHGVSDNLIHRAADVHLKERRKLVLVPRETPLGLIQLRNLAACVEAGAIVLPAMPAFYTKPASIQDLIDFIVGRICDQLGVEHRLLKRWGQPAPGGE
jgi:4-hydroxy-3-polyprenylbenzoate decarboxylase